MAKKKVFLSPGQRKEVLALIQANEASYGEIAAVYNVTPGVISKIACKAGIITRKPRKQIMTGSSSIPAAPPDTIQLPAPHEDISLLDQLETAFQAIEANLKEWITIKHNACRQVDIHRKKQSELYVAIQALQRAKTANQETLQ
jgi:sRNA-binding carbon storage regulator CsrA